MTTAIPEPSHHVEAERKELPPLERLADKGPSANDATYGAGLGESVAHGAPAANAPVIGPTIDPEHPPGKISKSIAHWVHQHPEAHKHGVGSLVYQYVRSAVASVPYGIMMALTLAGFTKMQSLGEGIEKTASSGIGKRFGNGLAGFAKFGPAKTGALVAASFTFYRGTSKLGKWMTEYLFNPKDTEQHTAEKVDDLLPEAWRKIKEIAPAESASTPISAVVLGFIVSAFTAPFNAAKELWVHKETGEIMKAGEKQLENFKNIAWTQANFKATEGVVPKLKLLGSVIAHPKAKFLSHAAINSFGYALFFELGDRLFKDVQIRRGVWPGEHNSIKALKAAPDEYEKGIQDGIDAGKPKFEDSAALAAPEKHHYAFFDSEPSLGRFVFRRLAPTALGITLYTAVKMRWAGMTFNNFQYDKGITLKEVGKKAWGEGLATSLFFLIPIISEPWEKIYDNFFERKEKIAQAKDHAKMAKKTKPLNEHQQAMYEDVLDKLNAKEQVVSRSA